MLSGWTSSEMGSARTEHYFLHIMQELVCNDQCHQHPLITEPHQELLPNLFVFLNIKTEFQRSVDDMLVMLRLQLLQCCTNRFNSVCGTV